MIRFRSWLCLAVFSLLAGCAHPASVPAVRRESPVEPRPDPALLAKLQEAVAGFDGDVGIYARHLGTGATAEIRADEKFPTASMIKVPLLAALYQRVERGEFRLDSLFVFRDSLRYADSDLTGKLRDGQPMPLSELAFLMISFSDNTASLWIQELDGGGEAVNRWLAEHGFQDTRVNSRTPGRRGDWEVYGWGQTTPREMSELMIRIRQGRVVSPAASERMYRTLSSIYYNSEAMSQIPPDVQVASKQGAVDESRSETLLVNGPSGDYAFTIITKNQPDTSWTPDNAGFRLIRDVSRTVYQHFNPGDPWRPTPEPNHFRNPPDET